MKNFGFGIVIVIFIFYILSFTGCASLQKQKDLEVQGLRNKVSVLEAEVQVKDREIAGLKETLTKAGAPAEAKSRPKAKDIQTALQNAGYYSGIIDGRIGPKTREAIREFQRANNLTVDGRVGKETWNLLKGHLSARVK